jgi:hypothetical protein
MDKYDPTATGTFFFPARLSEDYYLFDRNGYYLDKFLFRAVMSGYRVNMEEVSNEDSEDEIDDSELIEF